MKWGPFEWATIYGTDNEGDWSPYLLRIGIGRFRIHVFYRGDEDLDPHDHKMWFYTFPLRGYLEEVYEKTEGRWKMDFNYVSPFWPHFRPAEYTHRVVARADGKKIITLSWWGRPQREWGFRKVWDPKQCWVPWKEYVFGKAKGEKCP